MKITAKFAANDGTVTTATFDQETGTVTDINGRRGTFSRAEGSSTIQIEGDDKLTITAKDPLQLVVGFTTAYTASNGKSGTVSIISIG